ENPEDKSEAVFLSTAHACKFPDIFPVDIAAKIEIPKQVKALEGKLQHADKLGVDFEGFRSYLLSRP
ncbi:MAG: threonine synthase, partial [Pedobacter sp.]